MNKLNPFCTSASDYPLFVLIQKAFKDAGFDVDYKEVGYGYSDISNCAEFHAVFFLKEDFNNEEVSRLCKYYKDMILGENQNISSLIF